MGRGRERVGKEIVGKFMYMTFFFGGGALSPLYLRIITLGNEERRGEWRGEGRGGGKKYVYRWRFLRHCGGGCGVTET